MDLCLENIMLTNCGFIKQQNGTVTINPDISIKLCDLGVAEIFESADFQCIKRGLTLDNEYKLAPEIFQSDDDVYDAQEADVWSLGIILFECMTGKELYQADEIWNKSSYKESGYWALQNNKFAEYVMMNNLSRYLKPSDLGLLTHLLDIIMVIRFDLQLIY